ncbi:hypothetical protein HBE96_05820 [Clostridium sp. P21]|uniref:Tn7-like transposition protein D n=1 Tax=Clostridium muellerianum TaxID=2716538 RepID=A0A7Y0EET5_9CLOT|nr:TnsD family Tn7-like transposition protein [Clostridium muellerianum]NMM62209.1 hypothetical protein [Clostridium muellerianum]
MIDFFTDPYPEELISSVCARYDYYIGNVNKKDTLMELFGKRDIASFKLFPSRLGYLEKQLSNKTYTSDYFIYNHTVVPLYLPFITKSKQIEVINLMKSEGSSAIYHILGISTGDIKTIKGYRYCPECVKSDESMFGEPYFHTYHQLQGVMVCHKHGCLLQEYNVEPSSRFIRLDINRLNSIKPMFYEKGINEMLIKIAKAAYFILTLPYLEYSVEDIKHKLMILLNRKNYITHKNKIRQNKLINDFSSYYGHVILQLLNSKINDIKVNWIRNIAQNRGSVVNPLRYILLILFLTNDDIKMFFKVQEDENPFGKGPWPCLNPISEHYLEKVIDKCEIENGYRSNIPKGIFKCKCGYVYTRTGRDISEEDMFRKSKVIERGEKWKIEFVKHLEQSNYNVSYTSKKMGCSKVYVKGYIERQGFITQEEVAQRRKKDNFIEYSNQIINYMKSNPNCLREDIRLNLKKQVSWFKNNNPKWLEDNLPKPTKRFKLNLNRISYEELDKETLKSVKIKYKELISLEKPKRITLSIIEDSLNFKLYTRIHNLPKTKKYFDEILETVDEFRLRRVKIFCDKLYKNEIKTTKSYIIGKTGILKKQISNELMEQINEIIDDYLKKIIK